MEYVQSVIFADTDSGFFAEMFQNTVSCLTITEKCGIFITAKEFCLSAAERATRIFNRQTERQESANEKRFSKENI